MCVWLFLSGDKGNKYSKNLSFFNDLLEVKGKIESYKYFFSHSILIIQRAVLFFDVSVLFLTDNSLISVSGIHTLQVPHAGLEFLTSAAAVLFRLRINIFYY